MKKTFSVQTFLKLAFFEGLASLLILFMIPSDPKNAWLWGFSKSRLSMAAFGMFLVGVVGIFSWRLVKNTPRLKRFSRQIEAAVQREGHLFNGIVFSAAGFLSGSYFIWVTLTTTNLFVKGYFIRLAPWVFWATLICAQTTVFLFQQNWPRSRQFLGKNWKALLSIFVILFSGILFHAGLWGLEPTDWDVHKMFNQDNKFDLIQQDIYAVFVEGDRLQQGINPYARALDLEGDLQWNATNATYMPVFYLLSWLTQKIGLEDFIQWVGFWRVIFLIANLGSAYLMFYVGYRHFQSLVLGAFAALLWLFNRWSIHMTMIYHIDFVAIFFFILSLILLPKNRKLAFLSFGMSLAVKHIAIFTIPLYLIWAWQTAPKKSLWQFISDALWIGGVPLLISAPFILWNWKGFFTSILISATRNAESHFGVPSVDFLLGLTGIPAKLPMLGMMLLAFWLAWQKRVNAYVAALFVMIVFVYFNSVLFRQYMVWVVPLIPLAAGSALKNHNFENRHA